MEEKQSITIQSRAIIRILALLEILIVSASITGQISKYVFGHDYLKGFVPLFYVDNENNIPTFFSVFLLLTASLLLALLTRLNSKHSSRSTWCWATLSFGFLYMAYDEATIVHERLIEPVRELLFPEKAGIFYFAWVIPAIVLVLFLGFLFFRFLLALPAPTRKRFLVAAALFLAGSIGFEMIGGNITESIGTGNLFYSMIVTFEEGLEMAGTIVFLRALLKHLSENYTELHLFFTR